MVLNTKLQNFLNSKMRYDAKAIAADDELSHQIQSRLIDLGLLKPPVDGKFGLSPYCCFAPISNSDEVRRSWFFGGSSHSHKADSETKPGNIPTPSPDTKTLRDTIFKSKPLASSALQDSEKQLIPGEKSLRSGLCFHSRSHQSCSA